LRSDGGPCTFQGPGQRSQRRLWRHASECEEFSRLCECQNGPRPLKVAVNNSGPFEQRERRAFGEYCKANTFRPRGPQMRPGPESERASAPRKGRPRTCPKDLSKGPSKGRPSDHPRERHHPSDRPLGPPRRHRRGTQRGRRDGSRRRPPEGTVLWDPSTRLPQRGLGGTVLLSFGRVQRDCQRGCSRARSKGLFEGPFKRPSVGARPKGPTHPLLKRLFGGLSASVKCGLSLRPAPQSRCVGPRKAVGRTAVPKGLSQVPTADRPSPNRL